MKIEIELYKTTFSRCPCNDWFENIRELHTRAKILTRLDRLKVGNFGDSKALGDGIAELRIHYGAGIRIYYSKIGNKGSQTKDISKAKEYLKEHRSREEKYGKK